MSWPEFLERLNLEGTVALWATWRMSDGTSLRKQIPTSDQVSSDDLMGSAAVDFGYKLYEIAELEFEPRGSAEHVQRELETIEQIARASGLIYRRKPERIIVRSPYTC
jgi:hypothetical protein